MLLEGSIHRFNLAGVLQFLAQGAATGVLEVRDFEEYGFIYLVDGRRRGHLAADHRREARHAPRQGRLPHRAAARRGAHRGLRPLPRPEEAQAARPAPHREGLHDAQTRSATSWSGRPLDQVFELAHWQNGVFLYDEPEQMPRFQVAIQGDVQELLLDAYRRIDEGERARKTAQRRGQRGLLRLPARRRVRGRRSRPSTSRRTSACGGRWARSWTRVRPACATRASSTARARRTRRPSSTPPSTRSNAAGAEAPKAPRAACRSAPSASELERSLTGY